MAILRQVARQPDADNISHLLVRNHLSTERQDIRTVVFATVPSGSFVVAHGRADAGNFIGHHA